LIALFVVGRVGNRSTVGFRRVVGRIGAIAALVLVIGVASAGPLAASSALRPVAASTYYADPGSPSPSLGSTSQPNRPLPGDNDSDPNDWSGSPWVVAAIFAVLVVVGIITFLLFRGHRLTWRSQRKG
jgi:hypothetical protein